MDLILEKATIKSLHEILDVFESSIKNLCSKDYNQAQISAWVSAIENEDRWKYKIINHYFVIVKQKNIIVGFGSLENSFIDLIYVHESFLRIGVASLIFKSLKNEAEKLGLKTLSTHASKTAVPFFESKKFKIIKENKIYRKGIEIINFEMTQ
jgi:putative acetyltransferase